MITYKTGVLQRKAESFNKFQSMTRPVSYINEHYGQQGSRNDRNTMTTMLTFKLHSGAESGILFAVFVLIKIVLIFVSSLGISSSLPIAIDISVVGV